MTVAGEEIVALAQALLGAPYVLGGAGPSDFDCSGLVQWVYNKAGVKVPRVSSEQYSAGTTITHDELQPGDLVFSEWPGDDVPHHGHVAIYAGNGQIIEAPHPGGVVQQVPLDSNYLAHVDGYTRPAGLASGTSTSIVPASPTTSATGAPASFLSWLSSVFGSGALGPNGWAGSTGASVTQYLTDVVDFFAAFFRPSTYIRIGAGFFGIIFLGFGLVFLVREAGNA